MKHIDKQGFTRAILDQNFQKIKEINPSYSKRAFAKKLGVSIGMLSEFTSCKRYVSEANLRKILSVVGMSENEWLEFSSLPTKDQKVIRSCKPDEVNSPGMSSDNHYKNILKVVGSDWCEIIFKGDPSTKLKVAELMSKLESQLAKLVDKSSSNKAVKGKFKWSFEGE